MLLLVAGLIVFLGTHAFTMNRAARDAMIGRLGEGGYKGVYSLASLIGFVMIVWGFAAYRETGWINVWSPPVWFGHVALLLTLPIFVLLIAAYAPGRIKAAVKHPMLLAVKVWATAHLLANGDLGSILMFGGFLAWAVAARISLKRRVGAPTTIDQLPARPVNDVVALVGGLALWVAFVFWLHPALIGVAVWPGR